MWYTTSDAEVILLLIIGVLVGFGAAIYYSYVFFGPIGATCIVVGYVVVALISGAFFNARRRRNVLKWDEVGVLLCAVFWPVVVPVYTIWRLANAFFEKMSDLFS